MHTRRPKQRSLGPINTRETLPTVQPPYTNQTIIINSPNCNIKYIHQGEIKFATIGRRDHRQSKSLLQIPISNKDEERTNETADWIASKRLKQLTRRQKREDSEERLLDNKKRTFSTTKHGMKTTVRILQSIYSDPKLNTLKGETRVMRVHNKNERDCNSIRKRKYNSPRHKLLVDRSQSPYLFSYTEKMDSNKTLSLKKLHKNTTKFRTTKYFIGTEAEVRLDTSKDDDVPHPIKNSVMLMNQNMYTVWKSYLDSELSPNIKSKYDIESYINTVRLPHSNTSPLQEETNQGPMSQRNTLHYDFSFDEEKRMKLQTQLKQPMSYRRKAYASFNKCFHEKSPI